MSWYTAHLSVCLAQINDEFLYFIIHYAPDITLICILNIKNGEVIIVRNKSFLSIVFMPHCYTLFATMTPNCPFSNSMLLNSYRLHLRKHNIY